MLGKAQKVVIFTKKNCQKSENIPFWDKSSFLAKTTDLWQYLSFSYFDRHTKNLQILLVFMHCNQLQTSSQIYTSLTNF